MDININITFAGDDLAELKRDFFGAIMNAIKEGHIQIGNEPVKQVVKQTIVKHMHGPKFRSLCLEPSEVKTLVLKYEEEVKNGKRGSAAIKAAMKASNINVSVETAQKALFEHGDIPGYEDIPVPIRTYSRNAGGCNPKLRRMVEEIKYLRDVKGQSFGQIIKLTNYDPAFVKRIYDKHTYNNILPTPENTKIFNERYQELKNT